MKWFHELSITKKLNLVALLPCCAALVIASTVLVGYERFAVYQKLQSDMSVLAEVIASNCTAALAFDDSTATTEVLESLKADQNVVFACVYRPGGEPFARFGRAKVVLPDQVPAQPATITEKRTLTTFRPIVLDQRQLGILCIQYDLSDLEALFWLYLLVALLSSIIASGIAFLVSTSVRKEISRPILKLATTAESIATRADFSVRAEHSNGDDEIGTLVRAFNGMLDQIETQNRKQQQAEEEIRTLNRTLEARVAERTESLEQANKELESFSYSVSHDLRAPLRHIGGFADLLLRQQAAQLDEAGKKRLVTITEAAARMGELIDDLLVFSRMGRSELQNARVNLQALVDGVIRDLEPDTRGRRVLWTKDPLPMVQGDAAMLRLAFGNLLGNAVKYTGTREEARIHIGIRNVQDDEVVIFVQDNGVGFNMDYVGKLFGVFQRLHRAEDFPGTGIGLANVRRIIQRHRGTTWAEGTPNVGATFYISLPKLTEENGQWAA